MAFLPLSHRTGADDHAKGMVDIFRIPGFEGIPEKHGLPFRGIQIRGRIEWDFLNRYHPPLPLGEQDPVAG
nr:hypothetical protein [Pannonibacter sp. P2PFMT1]